MIYPDWFKIKGYPHIGLPVTIKDFKWIKEYVTSEEKVNNHSFLPLLHMQSKVRQYRKQYDVNNGKLLYGGLRIAKVKKRNLHYASHLDALIYSYYAEKLGVKYENYIEKYNLNDVVSAYRKIPTKNKSEVNDRKKIANKCSIHFAKDIFITIKEFVTKNNEACVIAFDIKGFFDNLDHQYLRRRLEEIVGVDENQKLPKDWFHIFKSITRYRYVEKEVLFSFFHKQLVVRKKKHKKTVAIRFFCNQRKITFDYNDKDKYCDYDLKHDDCILCKRNLRKKRISSQYNLKNENVIAYCCKKDFVHACKYQGLSQHVKRNINPNGEPSKFGIPQGTPISAVLANLYMSVFDKVVKQYLDEIGGVYRRYSDDMVVVCPEGYRESVIKLFNKEIQKCKLKIQDKKTQIFRFENTSDGIIRCAQIYREQINCNKNLIYLGFEFDGEKCLIKSGAISNYYRKMHAFIRRSEVFRDRDRRFLSQEEIEERKRGEIYYHKVYKRYSYKGAKSGLIFRKQENGEYVRTKIQRWGNFLYYINKSESILGDLAGKDKRKRIGRKHIKIGEIKKPISRISGQGKKHWSILVCRLNKASYNGFINIIRNNRNFSSKVNNLCCQIDKTLCDIAKNQNNK
ncbi:reverse transcriptase domain-containing protein [Prolixibacteraceae bacterium]|nr:reverse transcriptase domain-containing protein [Prolixibacteraceae bacterium]